MKWFKHDSNACADAKLQRIRMKYGMEGYGLYWYCLELIADNVDENNLTFELEHDAELIAHSTGIHYERVEEMMRYMVDLGLFESEQGRITCLKMAQRLDQSMTSSPRMRDMIKKIRENHDSVMINHDSVMLEQTRLDKTRKEKKDQNKGRRFTPPCVDDVREYCNSRGNQIDPEEFIDHYEANGWMRGKNKIKDWKACVRTWEKNREKNQSVHDRRAMQSAENLARARAAAERLSRRPVPEDGSDLRTQMARPIPKPGD